MRRKVPDRRMWFTQVLPNIWHADFASDYVCSSALMRMQEFYESPDSTLRGKFFTVDMLMDSEAARWGTFDYFNRWGAYNVPGPAVAEFFAVFKGHLRRYETSLLDAIASSVYRWKEGEWYLIGTGRNRNQRGYLKHEVAHGLYFINPEYKDEMNEAERKCGSRRSIRKRLKADGYRTEVLRDEFQAYLSTSTDSELVESFGLRKPQDTAAPFRRVFRRYYRRKHRS